MKGFVFGMAAFAATAVPALAQISIIGDVTNTTVTGNFGTTAPSWEDASAYHYYTFTAAAGTLVTFSATRTTDALDPTIFIFAGNMGGTAFDGTNPFGRGTWLGFDYVAFADDEIDHPVGPWGDPVGSFTATVGGTYTPHDPEQLVRGARSRRPRLLADRCSGPGVPRAARPRRPRDASPPLILRTNRLQCPCAPRPTDVGRFLSHIVE